MKRLFQLLIPLALVACVSSPEMVQVELPLVRSVERVVSRHDAYVQADDSLDADQLEIALTQSQSAIALMVMPEVSAPLLGAVLEPVMNRHDDYVSSDPELDVLERTVFLETTVRLRALIAAAPDPVSSN